jgi:hypothetical protein
MARAITPDVTTELRRGLEGPLRFIVHGVESRDGRIRVKPKEGRKRAVACLEMIKRHLDAAGIDPSLTQPLQDVLDAFAEADRGISHPLFAPAPLKGRPPATLAQRDVMWVAVHAIDLYLASGRTRGEAAHLVAKELRKRGVQIRTNGPLEGAILHWRHELTKAGRGQGRGRTNGDWNWFGMAYLFQRDERMRQVKEGTLSADAEANVSSPPLKADFTSSVAKSRCRQILFGVQSNARAKGLGKRAGCFSQIVAAISPSKMAKGAIVRRRSRSLWQVVPIPTNACSQDGKQLSLSVPSWASPSACLRFSVAAES